MDGGAAALAAALAAASVVATAALAATAFAVATFAAVLAAVLAAATSPLLQQLELHLNSASYKCVRHFLIYLGGFDYRK